MLWTPRKYNLIRIHPKTVWTHSRIPRKKTIYKPNKTRDCKTLQNWKLHFWKNLTFTDESKFNIYSGTMINKECGRNLIQRDVNSIFLIDGGFVMVWTYMSAAGVTILIVKWIVTFTSICWKPIWRRPQLKWLFRANESTSRITIRTIYLSL